MVISFQMEHPLPEHQDALHADRMHELVGINIHYTTYLITYLLHGAESFLRS